MSYVPSLVDSCCGTCVLQSFHFMPLDSTVKPLAHIICTQSPIIWFSSYSSSLIVMLRHTTRFYEIGRVLRKELTGRLASPQQLAHCFSLSSPPLELLPLQFTLLKGILSTAIYIQTIIIVCPSGHTWGFCSGVSVWNRVYFCHSDSGTRSGQLFCCQNCGTNERLLPFPLGSRCTFTQTRRFRLEGQPCLMFFSLEQGIYFFMIFPGTG